MKQLLSAQRNDMIRALSGRGQYRVCDSYHFLTVSLKEWNKMRPDQRKCVVKVFDDFTPTFSTVTSVVNDSHSCVGLSSTLFNPTQCLSVTAEDSNIISIPLVTLHGMWSKANSLLANAITDATAKMVLSYRSVVPHLVRKKGKAQYVCDDNCLQWLSSKICSHSLAVAETRKELPTFLEWYVSSGTPNITTLAMTGMPPGKRRNKNLVKCTRSKKKFISTDSVVSIGDRSLPLLMILQQPLPLLLTYVPVSSSYPPPFIPIENSFLNTGVRCNPSISETITTLLQLYSCYSS